MNIVSYFQGLVSQINRLMVALGSLGLAAASLILSYSVVSRSLFNATTDWQDEAAVFCLVGVTFLSAAFVQERRSHIGISAVAGLLPGLLEKLRVFFIDLVSLAFCSFFTWKSWTLWHEAWSDGQVTSSSWGPPLSIPYGLMAAGMSLLCLQLLLHTLGHLYGVTTTAAKGH
jgi:TRAP-type C4-dicarboxylate transport system permease small subunit